MMRGAPVGCAGGLRADLPPCTLGTTSNLQQGGSCQTAFPRPDAVAGTGRRGGDALDTCCMRGRRRFRAQGRSWGTGQRVVAAFTSAPGSQPSLLRRSPLPRANAEQPDAPSHLPLCGLPSKDPPSWWQRPPFPGHWRGVLVAHVPCVPLCVLSWAWCGSLPVR